MVGCGVVLMDCVVVIVFVGGLFVVVPVVVGVSDGGLGGFASISISRIASLNMSLRLSV